MLQPAAYGDHGGGRVLYGYAAQLAFARWTPSPGPRSAPHVAHPGQDRDERGRAGRRLPQSPCPGLHPSARGTTPGAPGANRIPGAACRRHVGGGRTGSQEYGSGSVTATGSSSGRYTRTARSRASRSPASAGSSLAPGYARTSRSLPPSPFIGSRVLAQRRAGGGDFLVGMEPPRSSRRRRERGCRGCPGCGRRSAESGWLEPRKQHVVSSERPLPSARAGRPGRSAGACAWAALPPAIRRRW